MFTIPPAVVVICAWCNEPFAQSQHEATRNALDVPVCRACTVGLSPQEDQPDEPIIIHYKQSEI